MGWPIFLPLTGARFRAIVAVRGGAAGTGIGDSFLGGKAPLTRLTSRRTENANESPELACLT
jgi:hypothetical protein